MNATTQQDVKTLMETMYRMVRVYHLDIYNKILKGDLYADTLISKVKSILGNTVDYVYTQDKFVKVYRIKAWREAVQSIIDSTEKFGVPETLITDVSGEFTGRNTEFVKYDRWMSMQLQNSEQGRNN